MYVSFAYNANEIILEFWFDNIYPHAIDDLFFFSS